MRHQKACNAPKREVHALEERGYAKNGLLFLKRYLIFHKGEGHKTFITPIARKATPKQRGSQRMSKNHRKEIVFYKRVIQERCKFLERGKRP